MHPVVHHTIDKYHWLLAFDRHHHAYAAVSGERHASRTQSIGMIVNNHSVGNVDTSTHQGTLYAEVVRNGEVTNKGLEIFRMLGCSISYDRRSKVLYISELGRQIDFREGSNEVHVDGESIPLNSPVLSEENRVSIPLRTVVELLGSDIRYYRAQHPLVVISDSAITAKFAPKS